MNKIIIFSGTTEGRLLSEKLSRQEIPHTVCVASDYGKEMMEEDPVRSVQVGRMDLSEMKGFFRDAEEDTLVFDATHPYAVEVTANIKAVTEAYDLRYFRIVRDSEAVLPENADVYTALPDCAKALEQETGNILLATGSKELAAYCGAVSEETRTRTYVRVLPSVESLKLCEAQGIAPDHIIAMHGPFSSELNEAILRQYEIRHLVTRESGAAGGFQEKLDAAATAGVRVHVIKRPAEEQGITVSEAAALVTGKEEKPASAGVRLSLIGAGMGNASCMTEAAKEELSGCDIVFGAERLLQGLSCKSKLALYRPEEILAEIEKKGIRRATVVFSGDTGFYSGAKAMIKAVKERGGDISCRVFPGISAVSYLAARLGEQYEDAVLFSLHGRNSEEMLPRLIWEIRYHEKVFVLLSGAAEVRVIAGRLAEEGIDAGLFIGVDLSYEKERVEELSLAEAAAFTASGPVTAMIRNLHPEKRPLAAVRKDDAFLRGSVPMTKACVRHESILRLMLREGDVFYDIGGGTGSVAIEAATLHPGLSVVTFEKNPEAAELIRQNSKRLNTPNVTVVEGAAEEALSNMPKPDCVFIGGSGGKLAELIQILHAKGNGIRFVINAVSMETIEAAGRILAAYPVREEETVVLSVSEVKKTGDHHMLHGQNPVWIFSFTI